MRKMAGKLVRIGVLCAALQAVAGCSPSAPYTWPAYQPNLNYHFAKERPEFTPPAKVLNDVTGVAGTVTSGWWCFRYGGNANALVTEAAWTPMLKRMNEEWREALEPLGTDWHKPFLETAPALIVVFRQTYGLEESERRTNYYTQESVGIATGFLIAALHHAGLATLTHTPSPMGFLGELLERPPNEKAYVLLPVGHPAEGCQVPDLVRKPLNEIRKQR